MHRNEWWEAAVEALRAGTMDADQLVEMYRAEEVDPKRPPTKLFEYVRDIERRLRGELAPYIVMAAGDWQIETPDDLWMEPAWNELEVDMIWDVHDGRSRGTMVVAVYKWDNDGQSYRRDTSWGMLGNEGKTRAAQHPEDALFSYEGEE